MIKQLAALALTSVFLAGCGGPEGSTGKAGGSKVEVAAFAGGYGIDFYQKAGLEFEKVTKGVTVVVDGGPRVWEQLQPRFVSGDVPDVTFPGWGFDHWTAAYEGQLKDLTADLDGKPFSGEGKWRDAFIPSILRLGEYDGKQYVLPYYVSVTGWWYDPGLFARQGLTPPNTFEELLEVGAKLKAKGLAPITFQGKYPDYMLEGFLVPWIISAGGMQALDDCQALRDGAWNSSAVLTAAQMIAQLRDLGYFQKGATSMDHTQSQTEFVNGRAAMIPCGSWLYAEMKDKMPSTAKMAFLPVPVPARSIGDKTAVGIRIEPWMIPSGAKNPQRAVEFFKFLTSEENVKKFSEEKGALMALKGTDVSKLPEANQKAAEALANSRAIWSAEYRSWYKDFNKELEGAMSSLLSGELTPEAFCDRVEKKAAETRADPDVKKRTISH